MTVRHALVNCLASRPVPVRVPTGCIYFTSELDITALASRIHESVAECKSGADAPVFSLVLKIPIARRNRCSWADHPEWVDFISAIHAVVRLILLGIHYVNNEPLLHERQNILVSKNGTRDVLSNVPGDSA